MQIKLIMVLTAALLASGCTRENAGYDPTLRPDGGPSVGDDGLFSFPPQADSTPSGPRCGDGQCQAGESPVSCPADCQACPAGTTSCQGKSTISYCKDGAWRTESCAAVCAAEGYHYAVQCAYTQKLGKEACLCGHHARFGELCDDAQVRCAPGLFCGIFAGQKVGYCTRYCPTAGAACPGAPPATSATCSLESGGKNTCGFVCPFGVACPKDLTCDIFSGLCKP